MGLRIIDEIGLINSLAWCFDFHLLFLHLLVQTVFDLRIHGLVEQLNNSSLHFRAFVIPSAWFKNRLFLVLCLEGCLLLALLLLFLGFAF